MPDPIDAYRELIQRKAQQYGVDPATAMALVRAESRGDPRALSPVGAMGLMQLMPATAADYGVSAHELYDPERNLDAGLPHFKRLQGLFPDRPDLQYAAYNAGEGAVQKYGGIPPYRQTQDFVKRVQEYMAQGQPAPVSTTWATGDPVKTAARLLRIYSGQDPVYRPDPEIAAQLKALQEEIEEIPAQYGDVRASRLYERLDEALGPDGARFSPEATAGLAKAKAQLWSEMGGSSPLGFLGGVWRGFSQAALPHEMTGRPRVDWPTEMGPLSGWRGVGHTLGSVIGGYAPIAAAGALTGGLGLVPAVAGVAIGGGLSGLSMERNRQFTQDREMEALRAALASSDNPRTRETIPYTPEQLAPRDPRTAKVAQGLQATINALTWPAGVFGVQRWLGPGLAQRFGPALTSAITKLGPKAFEGMSRAGLAAKALPVELAQLGINALDMGASMGVVQGMDPVAKGVNPWKLLGAYPEISGIPLAAFALGLAFPKGQLARSVHLGVGGPHWGQAQVPPPPVRPTAGTPTPAEIRAFQPYQPGNIRADQAYQGLVGTQGRPIEGLVGSRFQQLVEQARKDKVLEEMAGQPVARLEGPDLPAETYYHGPLRTFDEQNMPEVAGKHMVTYPDPADPGYRKIKFLNDVELESYRRWMRFPKTRREIAFMPGDYVPPSVWGTGGVPQEVSIPGVDLPVTGRAFGETNELGEVIVYHRDPRAGNRLVRSLFDPEVATEWKLAQEARETGAGARPIADSIAPILPRRFEDIPDLLAPSAPIPQIARWRRGPLPTTGWNPPPSRPWTEVPEPGTTQLSILDLIEQLEQLSRGVRP